MICERKFESGKKGNSVFHSFLEPDADSPFRPSYGALASFLSTGIKKDGELVGVFCTQMPPESKPVEISEMQPLLEKAEATMSTAVTFYVQGATARDSHSE